MTATATPARPRRTVTPEKLELAKRLHARHVTYAKIGEAIGVDPSTAWAVLNPDRYQQRKLSRDARAEEEARRPRKVGQMLPWEGVHDDEYHR